MSKQAALTPKDIALTTVPDLNTNKFNLTKNPMDHDYMKQTKNMMIAEQPNAIYERDQALFTEEKIFNLIVRYQDLILSECESDDDIVEKGDTKKKEKKKKGKGKSKKKGKGSAKKKKGKSKKK